MEKQRKPVLVILALVVGVAIAFWFLSEDPPKPQHEEFREPASVMNSSSASLEIPEIEITDNEEMNIIQVDWNLCLDDLQAPECIDAITPLIAEIDVVGELGWPDLMDRLAVNTERVSASLADPDCTPPVSGFEPVSDTAEDHCAARAFGELGALLRGCSRSFDGRGDSYERRRGHSNIAAQSGITDLGVLDALTQVDRLDRLESTWLLAKCDALVSTLGQLPAVDALMDQAPSLGGHGERPLGYPWRLVRASNFYVERAVLMGDFRLADRYYVAARATASLKGLDPLPLLEVGDESRDASARAFEAQLEQIITKIVAENPAVGYEAWANHLGTKHPGFILYPSDENKMLLDQENKILREADLPLLYFPEEDWYQRTLDLLTYQFVAQRLSDVPAEVYESGLAGTWYYQFPEFDEILDANDREYASQRANEIVAELNRKP